MALGYLGSESGGLEKRGRETFDILVMHSLFQNFVRDDLDGKIIWCRMHDIVHDFAQFIRKSSRVESEEMNKSTACQACDPLLFSTVNESRTLVCEDKHPPCLCDCLLRLWVLSFSHCSLESSIPQGLENLVHLRWLNLVRINIPPEDLKIIFQLYNLQTLSLRDCNLVEVPREIGNLIHLSQLRLSENAFLEDLPSEIGNLIQLRYLNLSGNKSLKELPREIGNLIHLKHLNLSWNECLKKLPTEIGKLIQLIHLDLCYNDFLEELPESICSLQNLLTLKVDHCTGLWTLPEGVAQLTSLHSLGNPGLTQLVLLNKLNHLEGSLKLDIYPDGSEGVVERARKAELRNKINIQRLEFYFGNGRDEEESSRIGMDVMDALEPHPNLKILEIWNFNGSRLPLWMLSPLNQLKKLTLSCCYCHPLENYRAWKSSACLHQRRCNLWDENSWE
ncbi:hypothetical protein ACS0TY_035342 [Phlomoides rotata]